MGLPGFEPGLVDSESTVLAITPQALLMVRYKNFFTQMMRRPGIEPGPRAWKARILTIELSTLINCIVIITHPLRGSNPRPHD